MASEIDFSKATLSPDDVDLCIYHGECSDGFTSALACHTYFKDKSKTIEYHPASFTSLPPDVTGKNVLLCDFAYKYPVMKDILSKAKNVLVLDHHKTAEEGLAEFPETNKVFVMNHSGAYITWKYFFRDVDVPLMVKYVEDNDIWLKALPNTREFTSYLYSRKFTFEEYSKFLDDKYIYDTVFVVGSGMTLQNDFYIEDAVKHASLQFVLHNNKPYLVAVSHTDRLKSDIGNALMLKYRNIDFAICYSFDDTWNEYTYSLRSTNDRTDVSEIAKLYNGGGHRNASGCGTNYMIGKLIDAHAYNLLNNIYRRKLSFENGDLYDVVILNSAHNRRLFAEYLLSTKYIDTVPISQACSIFRNRSPEKCNEYYDFKIAIVWLYNGTNNMYDCVIHANKEILLKIIQELKLTVYELKNNILKICIDNFDMFLSIKS
uniref:Uncharacterized protein n=1 Tax=viral metagenome TaxID=1070528 RepID=A0A6C0EA78_9ZZZZ